MMIFILTGMCEDLTYVLENPSFEGGIGGWNIWYNAGQTTSNEAYSGAMSLAITTHQTLGSGVKQVLALNDP